MPYQKPKADHPWRQYANRKVEKKPGEEEEPKEKIKTIRVFLTEIVEDWDSVTIVTSNWNRTGEFKLGELPQKKIAAWLSNLLRRNYGG